MRSKCCWLCHRWCNWDKSWSLPSQFHLLVWSCGLIWDVWWGIPRTLNPVDLGWRHAGMWTSCASRICLWGHVGLWDRRSVGISHRGGFVGTSHRDRACVGISHSAWFVGTSHRSGVFDTAYSSDSDASRTRPHGILANLCPLSQLKMGCAPNTLQ